MIVQHCQQQKDKQEKTIEDFSHSHPYEYLTKLNCLYNNFNRSAVKDFSCTSKIKLPFKKFSTIRVPECFEASYAKQRKQLVHLTSAEVGNIDDNQKKLWKQHREIIKKYLLQRQKKKNRAVIPQNKQFAQKILAKDRNNIFLKKIIEKGTTFEYDQKKLEQEVLHKLKNLNKSKSQSLMRSLTAKTSLEMKPRQIQNRMVQNEKAKVSTTDYLQFQREQSLIVKYKGLIKQVDCSISEKSISKTCELLSHMQKIVDDNQYL